MLIILLILCVYNLRIIHISDIHTGRVVIGSHYNNLVESINKYPEPVDLVVISGDLTQYATNDEIMEFQEISSKINPPYVVSIGNHDVWRIDGELSHEPYPTGDVRFYNLMLDSYVNVELGAEYYAGNFQNYNNPNTNAEFSRLHNYVYVFDRILFVVLDWNSRDFEDNPSGDKRFPQEKTADLHDYENGTIRWFDDILSKVEDEKINGIDFIFLVQHHPFNCLLKNINNCDNYIGFTKSQKEKIMDVIRKYPNAKRKLRLEMSGHFHDFHITQDPLSTGMNNFWGIGVNPPPCFSVVEMGSDGKFNVLTETSDPKVRSRLECRNGNALFNSTLFAIIFTVIFLAIVLIIFVFVAYRFIFKPIFTKKE